jgi:hypothetical protein
MWLIEFIYSINGTALKRVDEINDLGLIMDERMSFLPDIEAIISKSSRMLEISRDFRDPYSHKTLYTSKLSRILIMPRAFGRLTSRFLLSGLS